MTLDSELTEEFLNRIKERYTIDELVEILDMSIDEFIDLTWDNLLENEFLQQELGFKDETF